MPTRSLRIVALLSLGCILGCARHNPTSASQQPASTGEATQAQVTQFCGACHAVPPPDTFPKTSWHVEVAQGYQFFAGSNLKIQAPPQASVVRFYEQRAPDRVEELKTEEAPGPPPVRFEKLGFKEPDQTHRAGISHVQLVHLFSDKKLDVLACDVNTGDIMVMQPYAPHPQLRRIARLLHPAHVEVVDLDGDGIKDIIVADLGLFLPADARLGRVVWLRGHRDGTFTLYTLLNEVGRVADVQMADLDGDGKQDLVVAEFGHHKLGSVIALMNRTTDWAHPIFEPHVIEHVTGTIHAPVYDLDGDGRPDIIAVQSQEHEQVVAYLNRGGGTFEKKLLYAAPHPDYGSSGIQLVDLNKDGRMDVLYTNGDLYDPHTILRADQGVQWLENTGTFPFVRHSITHMYGTYRAVAADIEGMGLLDIFAVSNVTPGKLTGGRSTRDFDSVILLQQTTPGQFVRYSLEKGTCDHFTCAAGDIYGDGKIDLVTGSYIWDALSSDFNAITIFRNLGKTGAVHAAH